MTFGVSLALLLVEFVVSWDFKRTAMARELTRCASTRPTTSDNSLCFMSFANRSNVWPSHVKRESITALFGGGDGFAVVPKNVRMSASSFWRSATLVTGGRLVSL